MTIRMSKTTFDNLQANATEAGIIAAAAMDQRGSLKRALEGAGGSDVGPDGLSEFKEQVVDVLSPFASSFLIDPTYGMAASRRRRDGCGLLFSYERSGYDTTAPGRQPDLLDGWSVQRLADAGANGVKLLVYYNPTDDDAINDPKHAFVERVGAECQAVGLPLFLEPVTYDDRLDDPFEYAKRKPGFVRGTMEEFSKPQYRVDVLKVEYPVDPAYTDGLSRPAKAVAYDLIEAREHVQAAAESARRPFIYLSAGVDMEVFAEILDVAATSGASFNGVLCGRATWKGAIPAYATRGVDAMRAWLEDEGVRNIRTLNETVLRTARPWWDAYGGRDGIEVA